MRVRDMSIPTALGVAITVGSLALRYNDIKKRTRNPKLKRLVVGFGAAHILLGTIDLIKENPRYV